MELDTQTVLNWIFGVCGSLIGVIVTLVWNMIKKLQDTDDKLVDEFHSFRVDVAQKYVSRGELSDMFTDIRAHLIRIEAKLDNKLDKTERASCSNYAPK